MEKISIYYNGIRKLIKRKTSYIEVAIPCELEVIMERKPCYDVSVEKYIAVSYVFKVRPKEKK